MSEITLRDILSILRVRLAWLIILPIVVGAAAGVFNYLALQDEYTSTAKLYVLLGYTDSTGNEKYEVSTSSQFAADFAELITTQEVLGETALELGWPSIPSDVQISVNGVNGTRVVNVSVTSRNAETSMKVANTLSTVFVEYIQNMITENTVHIAAEAQMPQSPSGPPRLRNIAFSVLLSLIGVAGICIAIDMLDTTLRTEEQVQQELQLPVLARVTDYREEMQQFNQHSRKRIPIYKAVNEHTRENIKSLALNIRFMSMDKPLHSLLLTSSMQDEGKTSIAVLLATAMALEGRSVLVVDLDYRSPSLGRYLGVRGQFDLSDLIRGTVTLEEAIVPTPIPGISLLDSCRRSTIMSRMMQSDTFDRLYQQMIQRYDLVIFDLSPIGMFVDAAEVAAKVDGVALIAACGVVDKQIARSCADQLRRINANVLGVVLNYVDPKKSGYYYRRYGYGKDYVRKYARKHKGSEGLGNDAAARPRSRSAAREGNATDAGYTRSSSAGG